jgi:hypothetical protein
MAEISKAARMYQNAIRIPVKKIALGMYIFTFIEMARGKD